MKYEDFENILDNSFEDSSSEVSHIISKVPVTHFRIFDVLDGGDDTWSCLCSEIISYVDNLLYGLKKGIWNTTKEERLAALSKMIEERKNILKDIRELLKSDLEHIENNIVQKVSLGMHKVETGCTASNSVIVHFVYNYNLNPDRIGGYIAIIFSVDSHTFTFRNVRGAPLLEKCA